MGRQKERKEALVSKVDRPHLLTHHQAHYTALWGTGKLTFNTPPHAFPFPFPFFKLKERAFHPFMHSSPSLYFARIGEKMKRARKSGSRKIKRGRRNDWSEIHGEDRLSDLPDSILLHIMSFMMIQYAVQTCVLSKRWKDLWKCIPNLILHAKDFRDPIFFSEFVSGILSCRDGDHPLLSLDFNRPGYSRPWIMTDLMRYAVSHRVPNLKIFVPYNNGIPSFVFSCPSLTSLDISVSSFDVWRRTRLPKSIELPALANLRLEHVPILTDSNRHAEPFSGCKKLNTLCIHQPILIMHNLDISWEGTLVISNARLANLTIKDDYLRFKIVVSTPMLSSFTVNRTPFQKLQGQEKTIIELQSSSILK